MKLDLELLFWGFSLAILDIPVYKGHIQPLHTLFSLYSEFKNSQVSKRAAIIAIHMGGACLNRSSLLAFTRRLKKKRSLQEAEIRFTLLVVSSFLQHFKALAEGKKVASPPSNPPSQAGEADILSFT